jgi:hypothetical protein
MYAPPALLSELITSCAVSAPSSTGFPFLFTRFGASVTIHRTSDDSGALVQGCSLLCTSLGSSRLAKLDNVALHDGENDKGE